MTRKTHDVALQDLTPARTAPAARAATSAAPWERVRACPRRGLPRAALRVRPVPGHRSPGRGVRAEAAGVGSEEDAAACEAGQRDRAGSRQENRRLAVVGAAIEVDRLVDD